MARQIQRDRDGEFGFKIAEHLGVIEEYQTGWRKEVNIVEWNGNKGKLDIRDWDPDHAHMSRGITLHRKEVLNLLEILKEHFDDREPEDEDPDFPNQETLNTQPE